MLNALDSIWIINSDAEICYLHRIFNKDKDFADETMFSGFISAILNFVSSTSKDTIEGIVLGGFDIYIKSFGNVIVVLSTKKNVAISNVSDLIDKVGREFISIFKDKIDHNLVSISDFEFFGDNIDRIFGLKTIQIIPEHEMLIELIKETEKENLPENKANELIIQFFKSLPDYKRKIIIENINKILMSVLRDSKKVSLLINITADVSAEYAEFRQIIAFNHKSKHMTEDDLIKKIVLFFDSIEEEKRPALVNKTKRTLEILNPSKKIDKDTKRKFEDLLNLL